MMTTWQTFQQSKKIISAALLLKNLGVINTQRWSDGWFLAEILQCTQEHSAIQRWAKLPVSSNVLLLPPISKAPLRFHRKKNSSGIPVIASVCSWGVICFRQKLMNCAAPPPLLCTLWKVREQWKCLFRGFFLFALSFLLLTTLQL